MPSIPLLVGAIVGALLLVVLIVLVSCRLVRSRRSHLQLPTQSTPVSSQIQTPLQSPLPVWDEKYRSSSPSSQSSSRYSPSDPLVPPPNRPRRLSKPNPHAAASALRISHSNNSPPNNPPPPDSLLPPSPPPPIHFPTPTPTSPIYQSSDNITPTPLPNHDHNHNWSRLQGLLNDDAVIAARIKHTLSTGPGARWLDSAPPSGIGSRSRARIKDPKRETAFSRQSFMTATSASVYSDHGPEPVGVAYGGEEYEHP